MSNDNNCDVVVDFITIESQPILNEGENRPINGMSNYYRKDNPRGIPGPGNQIHYHI